MAPRAIASGRMNSCQLREASASGLGTDEIQRLVELELKAIVPGRK